MLGVVHCATKMLEDCSNCQEIQTLTSTILKVNVDDACFNELMDLG